MKQHRIFFLIILFLFCGMSNVMPVTRFLSEDHYCNRVAQYLKVIDPAHASPYVDFVKLRSYLQDRIKRAESVVKGDIIIKQLEVVALNPYNQRLQSHSHNHIESVFPMMVQENVDFYLKHGAGKRIILNAAQKESLKIEASKEFAEQILEFVEKNKAKL